MKRFFKVLGGAFALVCFFVSCSTGDSGSIPQVLGSGSEAPVFLSSKAVSSREISFQFSHAVQVVSLNLEPVVAVKSISAGAMVNVVLEEALSAGEPITADLLVEDAAGNTLNVLVPFRARNDNMPKLLITELRTEYSKPKSEFVEFKTLEAGNLGALRLFITGNTKNPEVFEFPPVEVAAGEYIVIHLRTLDGDVGATNETGDNLGLSGGTDALADARDFWVPGTGKLLHKTDVVYFMDQDDKVIDAVMISEKSDAQWSKDYFIAAADLLHKQNAWIAADGGIPGPQDAVSSANIKTSLTRSISRDETVSDTNSAANWYITANSGVTPGESNNPRRFE
ncbi:hypothetical protein FACS1894110_18700 [Spirochaetia bacterium]|nr:hypothetical protein FACS1894110_18700 [Spirochaetia bacterium]